MQRPLTRHRNIGLLCRFATPGGKLHDAVKAVMESTDMLAKAQKVAAAARAAGALVRVLHAAALQSLMPAGIDCFYVQPSIEFVAMASPFILWSQDLFKERSKQVPWPFPARP